MSGLHANEKFKVVFIDMGGGVWGNNFQTLQNEIHDDILKEKES